MKKVALYLLFLMVTLTIRSQNVPHQAPDNPEFPGATPYFPSSNTDNGSSPVVLPASFDLRTIESMTSVKDQGNCTSGWAFATMAALEYNWKRQGISDTNLSENNLKNCHGFNRGPCSGGNIKMATSCLSRSSGVISEISDPYSPTVQSCLTGLTPLAFVSSVKFLPDDIQAIKQELYHSGTAIYSTLYWINTSYNSSNFTYYYSGTSATNHAVTLVGMTLK